MDVPKPVIPTYVKEKEPRQPARPPPPHTTTYSKSSADRTALIIGLIAVILIVIVIIAPIIVFIKVRYRNSASCKSVVVVSGDEPQRHNKNYQFAPVATSMTPTPQATLLTSQSMNGAGSITHLNGSSSMHADFKQAAKLPKKKDLKEWYV